MFYIPLLEGTTYYVYSAVEPFMATVHGTGTGKAFSMVAGAGLERNNPCAFADPCVHGMCVDPTDTAPLTCVCDVGWTDSNCATGNLLKTFILMLTFSNPRPDAES